MDPITKHDQPIDSHQARSHSHRVATIAVAVFVIGLCVLGAWVYGRQAENKVDSISAGEEQLQSDTPGVDEAQDTLLIELAITGDADKLFSLAGITQYNGYSADPAVKEAPYTLTLVGASGKNFVASFSVPYVIAETVSADGTLARVASYSQKSIVVKTPFMPVGSKIVIRDKAGKTVYEDSVRDVIKQASSADYDTLTGDDIE